MVGLVAQCPLDVRAEARRIDLRMVAPSSRCTEVAILHIERELRIDAGERELDAGHGLIGERVLRVAGLQLPSLAGQRPGLDYAGHIDVVLANILEADAPADIRRDAGSKQIGEVVRQIKQAAKFLLAATMQVYLITRAVIRAGDPGAVLVGAIETERAVQLHPDAIPEAVTRAQFASNAAAVIDAFARNVDRRVAIVDSDGVQRDGLEIVIAHATVGVPPVGWARCLRMTRRGYHKRGTYHQ